MVCHLVEGTQGDLDCLPDAATLFGLMWRTEHKMTVDKLHPWKKSVPTLHQCMCDYSICESSAENDNQVRARFYDA